MKNIILFLILVFCYQTLTAQSYEYQVELEAMEIPALGGLQSFAHAQFENEWLVIGGRLDGLHMRQPWAAFDVAGNNNQIMVINPDLGQVWKSDLSSLPATIREQLSSTNIQFHTYENHLILTGGYAYSPSADEHITFPYLTVVDVPAVIAAIKSNDALQPFFRQIEDEKFAVAGGGLNNIGDTLYLIGGHKFTGRYNPQGPDHGPGFLQEYTYEARPFTLSVGNELSVTHLTPMHDEMHLRRRDYNLVSQINNGIKELTVFSGVFQEHEDLPWLYPLSVTADGISAIEDFTQYYNHYHCANLPIYNADENEMHTIFFGGIAQFYDEEGTLVQDNDVPFVNTIADVSRLSDGNLVEQKLSAEMPSLMGSGSEFILHADAPLFDDDVLDGDQITADRLLVGYIYGGIKSDMPNVFWVNDGSQSEANKTIYKVFLKKLTSQTNILDVQSQDKILIYPNPNEGSMRVMIDLVKSQVIQFELFNTAGKLILFADKGRCESGTNFFNIDIRNHLDGSYILQVKIDEKTLTQKIIVNRE